MQHPNKHPSQPSRVEIARFPGDKRIAFTSSWDDGEKSDRRLVELLNRLKLPGTFNLISNCLTKTDGEFVSAGEVANLYAGHEVAIHTQTHPALSELEPSQIAEEVLENRKFLEDLVEHPVRGMAYPYGAYDSRVQSVVRALGIAYARTVEQRDPCFAPSDPLAWATTGHLYAKFPISLLQRWMNLYSNPHSRGLFCVWGHSYEIDRANDWAGAEKVLSAFAGHPDVWYCTNIQAFDYEAARNRVVISANKRTAYNPSAMTVTLRVDGKPIDVPAGQTVNLAQPAVAAAA